MHNRYSCSGHHTYCPYLINIYTNIFDDVTNNQSLKNNVHRLCLDKRVYKYYIIIICNNVRLRDPFSYWSMEIISMTKSLINEVVSCCFLHRSTAATKTTPVMVVDVYISATPESFPLPLCLVQESLLPISWLYLDRECLLELFPYLRTFPYSPPGDDLCWSSASPSRCPLPDLNSLLLNLEFV